MKTTALYDATCSLCRESKKWLNKIDIMHRIEWISLQEYEKKNNAFVFSKQDLRNELHIITKNNRVLKGFYAVRRLLVSSPLTFIPAMLLYIPFISFIGIPLYKWVAMNRNRFLRKKCDDGKCSI